MILLPFGEGTRITYPTYGKCCKCGNKTIGYFLKNGDRSAVICDYCYGRVLDKLGVNQSAPHANRTAYCAQIGTQAAAQRARST